MTCEQRPPRRIIRPVPHCNLRRRHVGLLRCQLDDLKPPQNKRRIRPPPRDSSPRGFLLPLTLAQNCGRVAAMGTPYITKENAADLARRKAKLYHANKSANNLAMHLSADEPGQSEAFRLKRLARERLQLERLDDMLSQETDAMKLDRLMSALNRLQEAEGWLAGRAKPKPGPAARSPKGRAANNPPPEPEERPKPAS